MHSMGARVEWVEWVCAHPRPAHAEGQLRRRHEEDKAEEVLRLPYPRAVDSLRTDPKGDIGVRGVRIW